MKITCNEGRNSGACGMACLVVVLISGLMLYQHIVHGPVGVGAWFWVVGIAAFLLLAIACIQFLAPRLYYRFSGVTLELVRGSKVLDQWDLESSKVQVLKDEIVINGRDLVGLSPDGKAFRIIVRRLNHLAQQGYVKIEPQRKLGMNKQLKFMILALVLFCVITVTFLLILAGVTFGAIWLTELCFHEMPCSRLSIAMICLPIVGALCFSLAYATCKRRKIFLRRIFGIEENDTSPPKN